MKFLRRVLYVLELGAAPVIFFIAFVSCLPIYSLIVNRFHSSVVPVSFQTFPVSLDRHPFLPLARREVKLNLHSEQDDSSKSSEKNELGQVPERRYTGRNSRGVGDTMDDASDKMWVVKKPTSEFLYLLKVRNLHPVFRRNNDWELFRSSKIQETRSAKETEDEIDSIREPKLKKDSLKVMWYSALGYADDFSSCVNPDTCFFEDPEDRPVFVSPTLDPDPGLIAMGYASFNNLSSLSSLYRDAYHANEALNSIQPGYLFSEWWYLIRRWLNPGTWIMWPFRFVAENVLHTKVKAWWLFPRRQVRERSPWPNADSVSGSNLVKDFPLKMKLELQYLIDTVSWSKYQKGEGSNRQTFSLTDGWIPRLASLWAPPRTHPVEVKTSLYRSEVDNDIFRSAKVSPQVSDKFDKSKDDYPSTFIPMKYVTKLLEINSIFLPHRPVSLISSFIRDLILCIPNACASILGIENLRSSGVHTTTVQVLAQFNVPSEHSVPGQLETLYGDIPLMDMNIAKIKLYNHADSSGYSSVVTMLKGLVIIEPQLPFILRIMRDHKVAIIGIGAVIMAAVSASVVTVVAVLFMLFLTTQSASDDRSTGTESPSRSARSSPSQQRMRRRSSSLGGRTERYGRDIRQIESEQVVPVLSEMDRRSDLQRLMQNGSHPIGAGIKEEVKREVNNNNNQKLDTLKQQQQQMGKRYSVQPTTFSESASITAGQRHRSSVPQEPRKLRQAPGS